MPSAAIASAICGTDAVSTSEAAMQARTKVARDHHPAHRPAVHQHAGERRDQRHRRHVRDDHQRDIGGAAVQPEGDQADHPEDGEEVAEHADELGQPERPEAGLREEPLGRGGARGFVHVIP
jgi:hypothetical protein